MSNISEQNLTSLVNASGFLFQLGIEHQIALTRREHHWTILPHEYPWRFGEQEGFIDIVLKKIGALAVLECKRTRGGTWVFLVPSGQTSNDSRLRCLWVAGSKDGKSYAGWDDLFCPPASYESEFCVIRGSGEGDKTLLERLSATLLKSIDGLAGEELNILRASNPGYYGYYLPIIVTNANLQICNFSPEDIDMTTGEVSNAKFENVPFIRFRKAFSTMQPPNAIPTTLPEAAVTRQRTVIVVNADYLAKFLTDFSLIPDPFTTYPWQSAIQGNQKQG